MIKASNQEAKIPKSFWQYLGSMGPGIIVALSWLGAGDLVDSAIAGGHYGYSLMWAMAIALFIRFFFVSIIAKYQLCNQHSESVISGLKRLHPSIPIFVAVVGMFFGHFYCSYMVKGVGEISQLLTGFGASWIWSVFWVVSAAILLFRGNFHRLEIIFYIFLIILTTSLIGVSLWGGPDPIAIVKGVFLLEIPQTSGSFGALLVVTSLIGAVGGSIANLMYPYFVTQKGWVGAKYRKVQMYDLAFGTLVLVLINLSIWTIGAEILFPEQIIINEIEDLANILGIVLGKLGILIFYLGVFATLYSSVVGLSAGFGYLVADAIHVIKEKKNIQNKILDTKNSKIYNFVVAWCLFTPLIWTLPNTPDFITLTIIASASGVVVLPILCGSLWYITSKSSFIGKKYKNKWWENIILLVLFILSVWGSYQSVIAVYKALFI